MSGSAVTFYRQLYFILGVAAGVLGGYAEASLVTRKLKREVEVVAWFLIPLGLIVWLLPIAYVYLFLATEEFLPFATYFLLPSVAIAMVTGGFRFRRFERRENARVFAFFLTRYLSYPKYWIETLETLEIELYGFLEAVAEKSTSWMFYYGRYAEKLKKRVEKLSERSDRVGKKFSEIKELTTHLLDENMKFYRKGIRIVLVFSVSCALWIALMFFAAANSFFYISQKYGNHVELILFGLPFLLIVVYTFIERKALTKNYEKTIQNMLEKVNFKTQTTIKDILELQANEENFVE